MKNLIYKELKLSIHPVCYIFSSLFCMLFSLIPAAGTSIAFLYCITSFPILLIGANNGKTTNDIYYSLLLPIRKQDIIKGKMFSFIFLEFLSIVFVLIGSIITVIINKYIPPEKQLFGLGLNTFGVLLGIALIGYAIVNFVMCTLFFKKARTITAPMLISIIFFPIYMGLIGILLPRLLINNNPNFWNKITSPIGQILIAIFGLLIFIGLTVLAYKLSAKRFDKSDQ